MANSPIPSSASMRSDVNFFTPLFWGMDNVVVRFEKLQAIDGSIDDFNEKSIIIDINDYIMWNIKTDIISDILEEKREREKLEKELMNEPEHDVNSIGDIEIE